MERLNRFEQGFSLLELSALIVVVAMAMSTILAVSQGTTERKAQTNAVDRRVEIVAAINDYLDRNGRYPCVAGYTDAPSTSTFGKEILTDCTSDTATPLGTSRIETAPGSGVFIRVGAVPTFDLLLPDRYMNDGFGNRYTYMVMEGLTNSLTYSATNAAITVLDGEGASLTTTAAYAVLSHGKDGKGAYRVESGTLKVACGATTNLDVENCDGDASLRMSEFDATTTTAELYNDDFLQYAPKGTPGTAGGSPSSPGMCPSSGPWPGVIKLVTPTATTINPFRYELSAGDINGDGADEAFIQNPADDSTYVVFGKDEGWVSPLDLSTLNATSNGFRLSGVSTYREIVLGDMNGDGLEDMGYYTTTEDWLNHFVFGKPSGWSDSVSIESLAVPPSGVSITSSGGAITTMGDFNNDQIADLFFDGAFVFGKSSWPTDDLGIWTLTNGVDGGFWGTSGHDWAVLTGDFNGDGFDDLLKHSVQFPGEIHRTRIMFGQATWAEYANYPNVPPLLSNMQELTYSHQVWTLAVGNVNGDAYDDILVHNITCGTTGNGTAHIVYGRATWSPGTSVTKDSLMAGSGGTVIQNFTPTCDTNYSYSSFADINGDDFDDIVLAFPDATGGRGRIVVIFGAANLGSSINPNAMNGTNGFVIDGPTSPSNTNIGSSLTHKDKADFNCDGFDDLLINTNNKNFSFMLFGKATWPASINLQDYN